MLLVELELTFTDGPIGKLLLLFLLLHYLLLIHHSYQFPIMSLIIHFQVLLLIIMCLPQLRKSLVMCVCVLGPHCNFLFFTLVTWRMILVYLLQMERLSHVHFIFIVVPVWPCVTIKFLYI